MATSACPATSEVPLKTDASTPFLREGASGKDMDALSARMAGTRQ